MFGVVKQSGGHIAVHSETGKGTTFEVYFPRSDQTIEAVKPQSAPSTLRGTETVLLVEDEEQVRAVMRSILDKRGYHVLESRNGEEAFHMCEDETNAIDLLVTDLVMPRMSGRELVERVAPLRPGMKVLFVSGHPEKAITQNGSVGSEATFLQKPITPQTFSRKVREVLNASK